MNLTKIGFALGLTIAVAQVSFAQTGQTTQAAPAVKKVQAKKVAKKSLAAKAPVVVAQASEEKKAVTAPAAAPTAPAQSVGAGLNADGTTSTTTAPAATTTKKWSVGATSEIDIDSISGRDLGTRAEGTVSSINLVKAGYKVTPDTTVGVRQYFTNKIYNGTQRLALKDENRINWDWAAVTVNTKTSGILGSEPIAPMFWYYIPTGDNQVARDSRHNGILRMDAEAMWNLTPKWAVSYYFNPRQSFVPRDATFTSYTAENPDGEQTKIYTDTRLVHYAFLYYNLNDSSQAYVNAGFDHRFNPNDAMRLRTNKGLLNLGGSFDIAAGSAKININPEIQKEIPMLTQDGSNNFTAADPRWVDADDLTYALILSVSL